jgi:DNA-binding MurR/RpiR family transcriptional regulator
MPPPLPPPEDFAALRKLIAQRRDSLPKRLSQIADFALRQPQDVALHTVAEIAAQAGVPPSAMVRFAQALGFAGFSDLQALFRAHARDRWPEYDTRLDALRQAPAANGTAADGTAADATAALLHGFAAAARQSLDRLEASLDSASLERAVAVLAKSDTVLLAATRRSYPIAAYLAYALRRLGLRCEMADHAGGLATEQVALLGPQDALLAISFTPYAATTVELAAAAQRRGAAVVAITDSPFSPLTQSATVWLEVAEADHLGFRALSASFALATTLAVAVAQARRGRADGDEMEHKF